VALGYVHRDVTPPATVVLADTGTDVAVTVLPIVA
jgi:hypothetical protein